MRPLYYYTSFERWPGVVDCGEVAVDELTTDADLAARRPHGRTYDALAEKVVDQ